MTGGIAAVTARLEAGTLRVVEGRCPNLISEAGLYRYDDSPGSRRRETPLDDHNHALAALRYMIYRLDFRRSSQPVEEAEAPPRHEVDERRPWWDPNWGTWVRIN